MVGTLIRDIVLYPQLFYGFFFVHFCYIRWEMWSVCYTVTFLEFNNQGLSFIDTIVGCMLLGFVGFYHMDVYASRVAGSLRFYFYRRCIVSSLLWMKRKHFTYFLKFTKPLQFQDYYSASSCQYNPKGSFVVDGSLSGRTKTLISNRCCLLSKSILWKGSRR